ncbi:HipA family kinase [Rheinheimera marina]|uniref:HipA family kinase n=1 Tax=Rheinheimera marina TaxID=1774958 RepID=A0ABV9JGI6_9GAMM
MEQVEIGLMLPGATLFNDLNINKTWKAHVKTHEQVVVAYVKLLSPRKLYIECLCAVIGRFLGLPIPKPIIVKVSSDYSDDIPSGQFALGYGSEDASYPSFRRHVNNEEAILKLEEFSKTLDIGVFDEWIANWDRNIGNILYDGGTAFSFIDHENAINENLLSEQPANKNQIVDAIYSKKSEFEKYKLLRIVQSTITPPYATLPLSLVSEKTYAGSYLSEEEILQVIDFLENRTNVLEKLFSNRLRLKQQEMAI